MTHIPVVVALECICYRFEVLIMDLMFLFKNPRFAFLETESIGGGGSKKGYLKL